MKHRLTILIAVLEAAVLLVMKFVDWRETKTQKPAAGKAATVAGHRVVKPDQPEYYEGFTRGDKNAAYLPAGIGAADEEIHEKD